jgi:HEAT repeat protein
MSTSLGPRPRALLAGIAACVLLVPGRALAAAQLFDLADRSEVVVWGRVESVQSFKDGKYQLYTVRSERVLKGTVPASGTLPLVQERLFDKTKPILTDGARSLVFAIPLPRYTLYREILPEGSYLQWTERLDTAPDLASLADPKLLPALERYLTLGDDQEARARFLGELAASPIPRLREGALAAIEKDDELAPLLDAAALQPVASFLDDERVPLTYRADTLVRLGRLQAAGIGPLAEAAAARGGPLLPAALDALVSIGKPPPVDQLIAYSRAQDEALRLVAVRGLATVGDEAAYDRVAAIIAEDPSVDVRIAALRALGRARGPRVVAILEKALPAGDQRQAAAAADALARERSPEAITVLEQALLDGSPEVRTAAAFALKTSGTDQGYKFLVHQRDTHPNDEVRRICKLALGDDLHEH